MTHAGPGTHAWGALAAAVWLVAAGAALAAAQPAPPAKPRPGEPAPQTVPPAPPPAPSAPTALERALAEMARAEAELAAEEARRMAAFQAEQARLHAALASDAAWQGEVVGRVGGFVPCSVVPRAAEPAARGGARDAWLYERGYAALRSGRWDLAVDCFARVVEAKGPRADGALYWKAYAQHKLRQTAEALATLAELRRAYPKSRYLADAQALEVEIRERAGEPLPPDAQENDELKLLALSALQHLEPERSAQLLEQFLRRAESPRLKERAIFLLAHSASDRAWRVLGAVARGDYNPDLQLEALRYIPYVDTPDTRALLDELSRSAADAEVKRLVVRAWGALGERERVLEAARSGGPAEVRAEAVRQLGALKATDALWELYQREASPDIRRQILQALPSGSDFERLTAVARTERDPELRRTAVRALGTAPADKSGPTLVAIYEDPASNVELRRAVIQALAIQRNDAALVALARKEKDRTLLKDLVERLSTMKTKVAIEFLVELLNK
jgi:TolA-binding protein